jgi:predicted NBD/HSP70 family sugar kinase
MVASLFLKVPAEYFEAKVKDIYIRAVKEIGDVPFVVVNDGDVAALAGAAALSDNNVVGIAMGTSQAGGFIDDNGCITGWLNELAFAPVDVSEFAALDEWSEDIGCGVKYFSQDAVIKLAKNVGIEFDESLTPGEKLKIVQGKLKENAPEAEEIFASIGCYLGHTLPYYHEFYRFKHVLLLGRVMSGDSGNIIAQVAKKVIKEEYPEYTFNIHVPDEKSRRLGQSVTAAGIVYRG